jgi:hypothetical protein
MNRPDARPRRRWLARIVTCTSVLIIAACASSHTGSPPPSTLFTVVNNTASTITIAECRGQIHHCLNRPAPLPPKGRLSSPLSSSGAAPNLLLITGSGDQARCLVVPVKPGRADITQATTTACSTPARP